MINNTTEHILALPRPVKRLLALSVDALLCALTVWLALCLRLESWVVLTNNQWIAVGLSLALALPVFVASGLYRAIFRYAGLAASIAVIKAMFIYGGLYAAVLAALDLPGVPRTLGMLQPLLLLLAVGASRALARFWLSGAYLSKIKRGALPKVLIYGAGSAGYQLAGAMANNNAMRAVGFLDDDVHLHGQVLNGLCVFNPAELAALIKQLRVSDVLLAIPSTSRQRRNEILQQIGQAGVAVRTLPGLMDLAQGRVRVDDLLDLDIDDLLGRDTVPPNSLLLGKNIHNKVVLVTGAGGSIGSELCRQIIKQGPVKLLLVESSEFALYTVHRELIRLLPGQDSHSVQLLPLLASVCNEDRMREIGDTSRCHGQWRRRVCAGHGPTGAHHGLGAAHGGVVRPVGA